MEPHLDTQVTPGLPPPIAPVPMSFPALLVNPKSRVAQLRTGKELRAPVKTLEIAGKGQGKRWIRRAENSTSFSAHAHRSLTHRPSQAHLETIHTSSNPQRAITSCRPFNSARLSLDPFLLIFLASALPPHQ